MSDVRSSSSVAPSKAAEGSRSLPWSVREAAGLYAVDRWADGYYSVSDRGTVLAHPTGPSGPGIDLSVLVDDLRRGGLAPPVICRFPDMLRHRVSRIRGSFARALGGRGNQTTHCAVYPIKANQQRLVCESVLSCADDGPAPGIGFEAGSKPELIAALAMTAHDPRVPIVCNGYKDRAFLDAVLLASGMGREVTPIVERMDELDRLIARARTLGITPRIGLRLKPAGPGAGRWHQSAGSRSKFGLRIDQIHEAARHLSDAGLLDCLKALHVHVGSQVCDLEPLAQAITELARIHVELVRLGARPDTIDVGGGLGLDYQGTRSAEQSSMNYSLDAYAHAVVDSVCGVCADASVEVPRIMTEAGRAMVAESSVLLFDVLGSSRLAEPPDIASLRDIEAGTGSPLETLVSLVDELGSDADPASILERAHGARDRATAAFNAGTLSLAQRSNAERLYWTMLRRLADSFTSVDAAPTSHDLELQLAPIYDANLSIFQSVPDAWAIGHVFPVVPIHRLDEPPDAQAVLGDMTCDSDGALTRFPTGSGPRSALPVHRTDPTRRYTLGCFLIGAYQEVLGDAHNLFGDVGVASVHTAPDGSHRIEIDHPGERASDVLGVVGYTRDALLTAFADEQARAAARDPDASAIAQRYAHHMASMIDGWTYPD